MIVKSVPQALVDLMRSLDAEDDRLHGTNTGFFLFDPEGRFVSTTIRGESRFGVGVENAVTLSEFPDYLVGQTFLGLSPVIDQIDICGYVLAKVSLVPIIVDSD